MPVGVVLELFPTDSMAKHETLPASGLSTATSVTSFSTAGGSILPQHEYALLAKLQGLLINAPPGPHPIRAGTHPLTKTKLHAKCKAKKEVKAKAAKDNNSLLLPNMLNHWQESRKNRSYSCLLLKLRPPRQLPKPKNSVWLLIIPQY
jgi:hypothetical protein